jgi:hypothetical protein
VQEAQESLNQKAPAAARAAAAAALDVIIFF